VGGSNLTGDDPRFLKTLQIDGRQERQQVCDTGSSIAISGSVWLSLCVLCYHFALLVILCCVWNEAFDNELINVLLSGSSLVITHMMATGGLYGR